MRTEDKQALAAILGAMAEYYGKHLSPGALRLMVEDYADLPYADVIKALGDYRRTSKKSAFPMPGEIRSMIRPEESPEDIGREVASRIIGSLSKFGWTNPDRAKEYIGELGWIVVQKQGGWTQLCSEVTDDNKAIIQAQLRDLTATVYRRAKAGQLDQAPGLPAPAGEPTRAIPMNFLKSIERK